MTAAVSKQTTDREVRDGLLEHRERLLDDALRASFPASDPPSIYLAHPESSTARV